jgi:2-iminobutanoate/2-iminopropanoate deaminase
VRKRRIETTDAPPSTGFRSQALAAGGFLFTGGQIGAPYEPGGEVRALAPTFEGQVDTCFRHLAAVTRAGGGRLDRVVELSAFTTVPGGGAIVAERAEAFLGYAPALHNPVSVDDCAMHGDVELDWAVLLDDGTPLDAAAAVLAPYMHAAPGAVVRSGPFLVLNGCTGDGGDMADQSASLLDRVAAALAPHGAGIADLVKLSVVIRSFDEYPAFNDVTKQRFADVVPPTRSVVVAPAITGASALRIDVLALAPDA